MSARAWPVKTAPIAPSFIISSAYHKLIDADQKEIDADGEVQILGITVFSKGSHTVAHIVFLQDSTHSRIFSTT